MNLENKKKKIQIKKSLNDKSEFGDISKEIDDILNENPNRNNENKQKIESVNKSNPENTFGDAGQLEINEIKNDFQGSKINNHIENESTSDSFLGELKQKNNDNNVNSSGQNQKRSYTEELFEINPHNFTESPERKDRPHQEKPYTNKKQTIAENDGKTGEITSQKNQADDTKNKSSGTFKFTISVPKKNKEKQQSKQVSNHISSRDNDPHISPNQNTEYTEDVKQISTKEKKKKNSFSLFSKKKHQIKQTDNNIQYNETDKSKITQSMNENQQEIGENNGSIDEDVRKLLGITDELLGKLPEDVINEFALSEDFELYRKVMNKYDIIK